MKKFLIVIISLGIAASVLFYVIHNNILTVSPGKVSKPSVAVLPFSVSGAAESGQYALILGNFADAVANQLGQSNKWTVLESGRKDMLEEELANNQVLPAAIKDEESSKDQTPVALAATYPSANYILFGQINGFEVKPQRRQSSGGLSKRVNRIRSFIDVRIVNVRTREWLVARTIAIDELLPDNSSAETQINTAIQIAAGQVVDALLLAYAGEFNVIDVRAEGDGSLVSFSGGSAQGVRVGMIFPAVSNDTLQTAAKVKVIEVRTEMSIAKVLEGVPESGHRVLAKPLLPESRQADSQSISMAIGGFFSPLSKEDSFIPSDILNEMELQIKSDFQRYGGIKVKEDRNGVIRKMLSQQMLDDLSKGRDPGLPMGSLSGVDYLFFAMVGPVEFIESEQSKTEMFGTTVTNKKPTKGVMNAMVYLVDVNSGEYVASRKVKAVSTIDINEPGSSSVSKLSEDFTRQVFAAIMLEIRPLSVIATVNNLAVLNHKQEVGITIGDRFVAMTKGETVVDEFTQTNLLRVGGAVIGELEVVGFDAAGWAQAKLLSGKLPEKGALLKASQAITEKKKTRKLTW
ncbi:MAG: CsgG/HfaB family protein [Desulfobacteraceae bacterium]|jgi:curli biogenesis system outer membrane secretion channel CsgG